MEKTVQTENDGRNDFDFFIGSWKVHHRALKARLNSSTEWLDFHGETVCRKILNGIGNLDENILYREAGPVHAITLRLFNPDSQEWSIYWATNLTGILDVPMIGGFKDGRGEFYAQELFQGEHVYSRFIWSRITSDSCQWEQALSVDGGKSWETNWIMEFERV